MWPFRGKDRVVSQQAWSTFATVREGERVFVTFDALADTDEVREKLPALVRVSFAFPGGLPSAEEANRLNAREDSLTETLDAKRIDCRLLGRVTRRTGRSICFATSEPVPTREGIDAWVREVLNGTGVHVEALPDWGFYDQELKPNRRDTEWIANSRVVFAMRGAGTEMSLPHALEFVFPGKHRESLAPALEARGYEVLPEDFMEGATVARKSMMLDIDAITDATEALKALAEEHAAHLDGWRAPLQRSEA